MTTPEEIPLTSTENVGSRTLRCEKVGEDSREGRCWEETLHRDEEVEFGGGVKL